MNILLADADRDAVDLTTYSLAQYGHKVQPARDNHQALRHWKAEAADCVLLDMRLPERGGLEVCRLIRAASASMPVIMLAERPTEDEIVRSFQVGADDFLAKPFSHRELAMRIRAVARRNGQQVDETLQPRLSVGDLLLDLEAHEVAGKDRSRVERLTPTELRILQLLVINAGRVVNTSRLVSYAWTYESADPSMLKIHISRLRDKLAEVGFERQAIKSLRWVGYTLNLA